MKEKQIVRKGGQEKNLVGLNDQEVEALVQYILENKIDEKHAAVCLQIPESKLNVTMRLGRSKKIIDDRMRIKAATATWAAQLAKESAARNPNERLLQTEYGHRKDENYIRAHIMALIAVLMDCHKDKVIDAAALKEILERLKSQQRSIIDELGEFRIYYAGNFARLIMKRDYVKRKIRNGFTNSRSHFLWDEIINDLQLPQQSQQRFETIRDVFEAHRDKDHPDPDFRILYPHWLQPFIDKLEKYDEQLDVCLSVAAQHGKSTLIFAWITWIAHKPEFANKTSVYIVYAAHFAGDQRDNFSFWLTNLGIKNDKHGNNMITFDVGNGATHTVKFGTLGSGITGVPFSGVCVCDDVIKAAEADSVRTIEKTWLDFKRDVLTRVRKQRLCIQTRWGRNDFVSRLVAEGWEFINIPAISKGEHVDILGRPEGEWLWPERWNEKTLGILMRDPIVWNAMYMGEPSESITGYLSHCTFATSEDMDKINKSPVVYGFDRADRGRDWSVIVRLACISPTIAIVTGVQRSLATELDYLPQFKQFVSQKPGIVYWDTGGDENSTLKLRALREYFPNLQTKQARTNPFDRYSQTLVAIRTGDIRFCAGLPNVDDHINALLSLKNTSHVGTDDLCALGAAYNACTRLAMPTSPHLGNSSTTKIPHHQFPTNKRYGSHGSV